MYGVLGLVSTLFISTTVAEMIDAIQNEIIDLLPSDIQSELNYRLQVLRFWKELNFYDSLTLTVLIEKFDLSSNENVCQTVEINNVNQGDLHIQRHSVERRWKLILCNKDVAKIIVHCTNPEMNCDDECYSFLQRNSSWHETQLDSEMYDQEEALIETQTKTNLAVGEKKPYIYVKHVDNNTVQLRGFIGDVWKSLEDELNYTSEYDHVTSGMWGSKPANGTWNGMVSLLKKRKIDIAVGAIMMTSMRASVIDFTIPLVTTRVSLFVSYSEMQTSGINWTHYSQTFNLELWVVIAVVILAVWLTLFIVFYNQSCELQEVLLWTVGIFCMQGFHLRPLSLAGRILTLSGLTAALVIYSAFSAHLIAVLTVKPTRLPFSSFEDFLRTGTHQLGVPARSGLLNVLDTSEDPVLSQLYRRWIAPEGANLPVSEWSGLSRVCSAGKHKYGFLASHVVGRVFGFRNPECHLIHLPDASIPQSLAFALPKRSQYRRPINQKLIQMWSYGLLDRLRNRNIPLHVNRKKNEKHKESEFTAVELRDVAPLLVALLLGLCFALFFLWSEVFSHRSYYGTHYKRVSKTFFSV